MKTDEDRDKDRDNDATLTRIPLLDSLTRIPDPPLGSCSTKRIR